MPIYECLDCRQTLSDVEPGDRLFEVPDDCPEPQYCPWCKTRNFVEVDDDVDEQPEFSLSFMEGYDSAVSQFTCICGHEEVSFEDDRVRVTAYPDWQNTLECSGCGREWRLVDDGVHMETRSEGE